jgi:hypothetical protein
VPSIQSAFSEESGVIDVYATVVRPVVWEAV